MARKPARSPSAEVYSITAAHRSHAEEMRERVIRYAITMSIRTAGFVLLVVIHNPTRWIFGFAAIVLPYVAVIFANAGRERTQTPTTLIGHGERAALTAEPVVHPDAPAAPAPGPAPSSPAAPGLR
jgi:Protein of unknown function (DUF3099)